MEGQLSAVDTCIHELQITYKYVCVATFVFGGAGMGGGGTITQFVKIELLPQHEPGGGMNYWHPSLLDRCHAQTNKHKTILLQLNMGITTVILPSEIDQNGMP